MENVQAFIPLDIRRKTREHLARKGVSIPEQVPPLLENDLKCRQLKEIDERSVALFGFLATFYEKCPELGVPWLERHKLMNNLTKEEKNALRVIGKGKKLSVSKTVHLNYEVQALWMLAWVAEQIKHVDESEDVQDTLGSLFPNISENSPPEVYMRHSQLRPLGKIAQQLDILYCLDWWMAEHEMDQKEYHWPLKRKAVQWRRHALEWVLSDSDWEDISLDT